jgi:hypothetical protein
MGKKIFAFITALFLVVPAGIGLTATVSIPDTTGSAGAVVQIPVEIDNPSGIAGFQFTLSFDSSVLQATGVSAGTLTENWLLYANTDTDGQINIVFLEPALQELGEIPGSLASIAFLIKGDIEETSLFTFSEALFYNSLAENISAVTQAGTFTVDVQIGDINGIGGIDISDVILCLRMAIKLPVLIGGETYSANDEPDGYPAWLESRGDMNGDGNVDISDVILILRKAIGLDP